MVTIITDKGKIKGIQKSNYQCFLGIPYAISTSFIISRTGTFSVIIHGIFIKYAIFSPIIKIFSHIL